MTGKHIPANQHSRPPSRGGGLIAIKHTPNKGRKETIMNITSQFYDVNDVSKMLGISKSKSYQILRELASQMKAQGFITVAGKISKNYFDEKVFYGGYNAGIQR